jgi:hypothetical protein
MDKLLILDDLEAYLQTFVGRCGFQSVGYGDWQDILAALNQGLVSPCLWFETHEESLVWDAGRLCEATFRLVIIEGAVSNVEDAVGIRALHRAAKKRLLPHLHRAAEDQQNTVLYQLEKDAHKMQFKVTLPEPLKVERKPPNGQDLMCGVYLDTVRISIVSPFQELQGSFLGG